MARLNTERQKELEPKRLEYAKNKITSLGFPLTYEDSTRLEFVFKGETVKLFPYSGWFTGKSIKDGRGIINLIEQIEK